MPTLKLRVLRLHGEEQEEMVRQALEAEAGVFGAVVSGVHCCIEVDFEDDEISVEEIVAIVHRAGFDAELAG